MSEATEPAPAEEIPNLLADVGAPPPPVETPAVEAPAEPPVETPAEPPVETTVEPPAPEPEPALVEPIAYPDWKLPEGIVAQPEMLSAYTEALQSARVPPEVGQSLLDLHAKAMQQFGETFAAKMADEQQKAWDKVKLEWYEQAKADERIGGAGHMTAMGAIARVRDAVISDHKPDTPQYAADRKAFDDMLKLTGVANHPVLLKAFHRMAKYIDEPRLPPPNPGVVPNGGMPKRNGFSYETKMAGNGAV